nr:putative RNA-dependent RNA polymerase [Picobirnavirus sp.]
MDPQKVLQEWSHHLDTIQDRWPSLVEFENDLKAKVGPMSVMKPLSERMEDIDHYYDDIHLSSTPVSDRAVKAVIAELKQCKGLTPRGQQVTVDMMKKSTNSGLPYFTKRKAVTKKTLFTSTYPTKDQVVTLLNMESEHKLGSHVKMWNSAAVLGWRGQEGGPSPEDVKQRVVWMFPYAVNIRELQVYQPFIECCQRFNIVPAWVSMDAVDQRITHMFDTKGKDDVVICTDFSKFDQHFNPDMQEAAKQIFAGVLNKSAQSLRWLDEVFPIKYMIPLMYDFGKVRCGTHGMGSGSGGTNADETMAHRALQYECALANGSRLNPYSQCLGDDGLLTFPGITVDKVIRSYTAHGQEMNESKQYVSKQDCVYLRRWHHKDYRFKGVCVGVYSTYRALGRLMYQERYYDPEIWSEKMVALRQLSILENVKYHPLCDQFAEFCMKRDKYRLGIDIPGFLDNIESIAKEATDLMPDFLGYTKSMNKDAEAGISNWWIIQYLKAHK